MSKKDELELDLSSGEEKPKEKVTDYGKKFIEKVKGMSESPKLPSNATEPVGRQEVLAGKEVRSENLDPSTPQQSSGQASSGQATEKDDLHQLDEVIQKAEIKDPNKLIQREGIKKKVVRDTKEQVESEPVPKVETLTLEFPEGFLWGTATSAYQIEGGNHNDWSEWENSSARIAKLEKKGLNPKDFICGQACDSYNRFEEDLDLAKKLNTNAIRFGIEWSRVEPKEGVWDVEAIKHYRKRVEAANKRGFKIILTLWHWTNPTWVRDLGGWTNPKTVEYYLRYCEVIIKELGSYIDYWVTLNEPNANIGFTYIAGIHPPGKRGHLWAAAKAFKNLTEANNKCYDIIHDHYPEALSGITVLANYNMPARKWCPLEWAYTKLADYFAIFIFFNKIKDSIDFIGLNSYKMNRIVWYPPFKRNKNRLVNEMDWEIYPKGIYHMIKKLGKYDLPILITENGTADGEDSHRAMFIRETLRNVYRAIQEGSDVRGYFHWSLLDNFEWAWGFLPKFGLYRVDRETFWRSKRSSANSYREICKRNAVEVPRK